MTLHLHKSIFDKSNIIIKCNFDFTIITKPSQEANKIQHNFNKFLIYLFCYKKYIIIQVKQHN